MEERQASRILEFVLRQPVEDWLAKQLLFHLPISSTLDPHLKKVLLLRRLSSDLSSSSGVSDETLDSLELLEELDRSVGAVETSEALVAAYSAVAADLTAAPLRSGRKANFFECVNRIWNCRVADLEHSEARGLMGEGLRLWRTRIEDAVVSDTAMGWLLGRDTRGKAVNALRQYLRVAFEELGSPLLERVASRLGRNAGASESCRFKEKDEDAPFAKQTNNPNQCTISKRVLPSVMVESRRTKEKLECGLTGSQRVMEDAHSRLADAALQQSVSHNRRAEAAIEEKTAAELDEDSIESPSSDAPEISESGTLLPLRTKKKASDLEMRKFARRRKVRRWTPREEDTLREAVKKHGTGNWKLILSCCSGEFKDRTEVDLKDKWRNMTRYKV